MRIRPLLNLWGLLKRKQADSRSVRIDGQQSARLQFCIGMAKRCDNLSTNGFRRNILCADLNDAWLLTFGGSKNCTEVEVVS